MPAPARSWLLAAAVASVLSGAIPCHTPASLVDADAELHMHGRQARGVVTVLGSIAGCRFQVSRWVLPPATFGEEPPPKAHGGAWSNVDGCRHVRRSAAGRKKQAGSLLKGERVSVGGWESSTVVSQKKH